jgi:hypothetical protein
MPRVAIDGTIKLSFVTTISDQDAPTVAELTAGTELQSLVTKDGLVTPADRNNVDDAALADRFDAMIPGTFGGVLTLTMKRQFTPDTDTAWDLVSYGTTGFIVIRRGTDAATAWTVADDVEVYPGAWHQKTPDTPAANEQHRFTVDFPVRSPGPSLEAVVA